MTIPFSQISPTERLPLFYAEISPSGAGRSVDLVSPSLILGQMRSTGTATAGARYLVTSSTQAATLFGRGSIAHLMVAAYLRQNPRARLYVIAYGDAGSSTAATGTLTLTGPATAAGTLFVYVGGVLLTVGVTSGMTATQMATAVAAAVTAAPDLPVSAAGSSGVVTFTAKCAGTVGNLVTLAVNARGADVGEVLPAGVGATLSGATLASGATDPTAATWVTAIGSEKYDAIAVQDTQSGLLTALKTELASRWGATRALDGIVYAAHYDSAANQVTLGTGRNDAYESIAGMPSAAGWLTPAYEVAGAYAGVAARELGNDPAAPLQTLPLVGVAGYGTNYTETEREALIAGGIATLVARNGTVYIEREATTYTLDANGDPDRTYEVVQTPATLSRIRLRLKNRINARFGRHKLANDGTTITGGQRIVTPQILKGELITEYKAMLDDGLVENIDAFKAGIVVERSTTDANRCDVLVTPDLMNQLRIVAMLINFGI